MHFYLYTCLKKTYKGARYHKRKSSCCHNWLAPAQSARKSNTDIVRSERPGNPDVNETHCENK